MQGVDNFLTTIRPILEAIYFIASTCLVATIVIGLIQLNLFKKDLKEKNQRAAIEKSLEYLNFYASSFLPSINKYKESLRKHVPKPEDTTQYFDGKFFVKPDGLPKELIVESLIKNKLGLVNLFNHLEFFSSAMLNRVADEDLVYKSVATHFCEFIEEEHLALGILRSNEVSFQNIIELYNLWKNRKKVQEANLKKQLAEEQINQIGDSHKPNKPIGL